MRCQRQTDRQTDRQTGRQAGRQAGRQDRQQTGRQAGRQDRQQTGTIILGRLLGSLGCTDMLTNEPKAWSSTPNSLGLSTLNHPGSLGQLAAALPWALLEVDITLGLLGLQTPHGTIIGTRSLLLTVKQLPVSPLTVHHHLGFPFALLLAHPPEPADRPSGMVIC